MAAAVLVPLLISAAATAASAGIEYLVAKNKKVSPVDRGKQDDIRLSIPGYGESIVWARGTFRVAPVWVWHTPIVHTTVTTPGQSGGKGSPKPPTPATVDHVYTTSLAGIFADHQISGVKRIWFDTDLVYNTSSTLSATKYEAESGTLAGGAVSTSDSSCSNGHKVTGIGAGGTCTISVTASASGFYDLAIFYLNSSDQQFTVTINGSTVHTVQCPNSGGLIAIATAIVSLTSGANTIAFSDAAAAPALDKIEIAPEVSFDDNGNDTRSWTGAVDTNKIPPTDQDISWPYYNDRPTPDSNGTSSTNLSKYGQPAIRIYTGTETQLPDSAIIADKGVNNAPAYRGVSYLVIEGLQLQNGRIPNVTIEADEGTTALDTIVEDIYGRVKVDPALLNVSALSGDTITGVLSPSRRSAAEILAELQTRFQFDMVEVDGLVKAIKRNSSSDLTIPYSELRAHDEGSEPPNYDALITDIDAIQLPAGVEVNYLDPELDYHNNTQSDIALNPSLGDQQSVSLSLIDSADNMKKLASVLLHKPEMEGRSFVFTTGPKYMRAHQGTVITLTLPNATHVVRVTTARYGLPAGVCEFEAVRQQASIYTPNGTGSVNGVEPPITANPGNTKGIVIDGPLLRGEDGGDGTQPAVYVAMCGRGAGAWSGGFLYKEFPRGSGNYTLITTADKPSNIGVTGGTLSSVSDATVWDRSSTLAISFYSNTQLSSATEQELLNDPMLNLIAVINPSTNEAEYLQFTTAVAGTPANPFITKYTISGFLRGRMGTDNNVAVHTSADDVVIIDSTIRPRRIAISDIGQSTNFKFVTSGQAVDDAATFAQTINGTSLKPLAPVHLRGSRNSAGDLLIEWTRRERLPLPLRDNAGTPISEESEIYIVEIYSGSTLERTVRNPNADIIETTQWVPLFDPAGIIAYLS